MAPREGGRGREEAVVQLVAVDEHGEVRKSSKDNSDEKNTTLTPNRTEHTRGGTNTKGAGEAGRTGGGGKRRWCNLWRWMNMARCGLLRIRWSVEPEHGTEREHTWVDMNTMGKGKRGRAGEGGG
jgi:hypothetical protein